MSLLWLLPAAVLALGVAVVAVLVARVLVEVRSLTSEATEMSVQAARLRQLRHDADSVLSTFGDLSAIASRPFRLFRPTIRPATRIGGRATPGGT